MVYQKSPSKPKRLSPLFPPRKDRVKSVKRREKRGKPRSEDSKLYKHLTPAYDLIFPLLAKRRIVAGIQALQLAPGDRVLEVGIGTGTSLGAYPAHAQITGIDLSEEMLALARKKIAEKGWTNYTLKTGNAEHLEFPDASFDCVTAFHVVSVVSDPVRMMREVARVIKPGGKVLIVNHFRSRQPWIAHMVDRADSMTRHFGWRTDLECDAILDKLPFKVVKRYKTSPWSLFTVVTAIRTPDS